MPKTESADKVLTRAQKAAKDGKWTQAYQDYQKVLERFPANKRAQKGIEALRPVALPALLKLAQAAQVKRNWAEAEQHLVTAYGLAPAMDRIALALAECQLEIRRAPEALATAESILKRTPSQPEAMTFKGQALQILGDAAGAEECFLSALAHDVTRSKALNNLGVLARAQGDTDKAVKYYRLALAEQPDSIGMHRNLALSLKYTKDEPHLGEMHALLSRVDKDDPDTAPLYFALFKALDELDEKDDAFAYLEKGNRLAKIGLGYSFQKDASYAALNKALFQQPVQSATPVGSLTPIFVTGLPRSGTTLVERILSRAQGVQACGELGIVKNASLRLIRDIVSRAEKPLTPADLDTLGQEMRLGLAEYSDGSPYLIDKMPLNFRWIGYICAALPEARIIHISRDPMAVAWSLYARSFTGTGNGFVYSPEDIAAFMVLHQDLMAHWHKCYPGRIFEIAYDDLVRDTHNATQAMAAATGLAWTPDWLTPEKATNQVLTASADQVRKPIYKDSNAQWHRYKEQLAPMIKALTAAGLITAPD